MKNLQFLTITCGNRCYDLPKTMPIPQKGDNIFIENQSIVVDYANYHITRDKLFMISLFGHTA